MSTPERLAYFLTPGRADVDFVCRKPALEYFPSPFYLNVLVKSCRGSTFASLVRGIGTSPCWGCHILHICSIVVTCSMITPDGFVAG